MKLASVPHPHLLCCRYRDNMHASPRRLFQCIANGHAARYGCFAAGPCFTCLCLFFST
jgi:hypothetical protein